MLTKEQERKMCLDACKEQTCCIDCVKDFKVIKTPCKYIGSVYKESIWDKESEE